MSVDDIMDVIQSAICDEPEQRLQPLWICHPIRDRTGVDKRGVAQLFEIEGFGKFNISISEVG